MSCGFLLRFDTRVGVSGVISGTLVVTNDNDTTSQSNYVVLVFELGPLYMVCTASL